MNRNRRWLTAATESLGLAVQALRAWTPRQIFVAATATIAVGVVIGIATVLIPNTLFTREIPPVWWNYPVWVVTSAMTGILIATYIRPPSSAATGDLQGADVDATAPAPSSREREERRTGRFAITGGMLAWFAVGCPVCNKIALLALGYTGALAWFAPLQPFLAAGALIFSAVAMVWRLRGQIACPAPVAKQAVSV
ncbi:hypothetical protein FB472_0342 [Rhodoglobus vestalii]|uniref:Uncharacterized protein n=1 Tax=Rhodoglobus vestalii TaxID=193384 RepID=A0A8H2PWZ0_9MICO|nr:hypothetical protein [Rhodoglobus vestalii]TQO18819.1 hypothetical protein FB472_0342 [Rhodoglobus vestalii]